MQQSGLYISNGIFSSGKTSNSVGKARDFDPFTQINIFNQPTGYSHIEIRPASDLVELVWDIYYYNYYYNGYAEKIEMLELYKTTLDNLEKYNFNDLFKNAYNIKKSGKFFQDLKTRIRLFFGKLPKCVLNSYQAEKQIFEIENVYLKNRQKFIDKYGEDLILNYFFYMSLDELQLYFGARNFAENFKGANSFLIDFICFPVKLNCRIDGICQNSNMLDVNFRRQASSYLKYTTKLFGFIKKSQTLQVNDTEKVRLDDSNILSESNSLNMYKIFGFPKLQYYRNHLISSKAPKIYKPGLLFEHIRYMTDMKNSLNLKTKV